jgi:HPt (histidine-containing phosphotransfer) domain-containing protein
MLELSDMKTVQQTSTETTVPAHAAVDMTLLLSFAGAQLAGEPDLIVELIDLYLADTPHRLAAMRAAVAVADELTLKRAAHSLKGSSASLGARQVATLCARLESIAGSDAAQVSLLLTSLEQALEHVRRVFLAEREKRL